MQQNTPDRESREPHISDTSHIADVGQAAPADSPYTNEEWQMLKETPVKICRAMMAVSPSGAIGSAQEVKAMRTCFKENLQTTANPTLKALHQQFQGKDQVESLWSSAGYAFRDRWDAANVRQTALASCQQCMTLLKKVPAADAQAYKEFIYSAAQSVASAAKEGGVMGFRGQAISEAEQSLLNDISNTLGLPRA